MRGIHEVLACMAFGALFGAFFGFRGIIVACTIGGVIILFSCLFVMFRR